MVVLLTGQFSNGLQALTSIMEASILSQFHFLEHLLATLS